MLKRRESETPSKFLSTFHETVSADTHDSQTHDVESLHIVKKSEVVEPPISPTKVTNLRLISHPQLQRDSLFRSGSDDALRLADTLTMPRTGSSSSSSTGGVEGVEMKSVPTTPEPGTPVRPTHQLVPSEPAKKVILNADGQVC